MLDQFRGCLLGQAVGDALGAPFETMPAAAIYYGFGFARKIISAPPVERLEYTDDTQMMIGIAETLVAHGAIKQDELMAAFVANFDPGRAYGPGTHQILDLAAAGGGLAETLGQHLSRRVAGKRSGDARPPDRPSLPR